MLIFLLFAATGLAGTAGFAAGTTHLAVAGFAGLATGAVAAGTTLLAA